MSAPDGPETAGRDGGPDGGMPSVALVAGRTLKNNNRTMLANLGRLMHGYCRMTLVVGAGADVGALERTFRIHRFSPPAREGRGLTSAMRAARAAAVEVGADVLVNVSHPYPLGAAVIWAARRRGAASVVRMTGDPYSETALHANPLVRLRKRLWHAWLLNRLVYARADLLVPVGRRLARTLRETGIPASRIVVRSQPFHCPVTALTGDARRRRRRDLGLDPEACLIAVPGGPTWGKGIDRVARVAEGLAARGPGYQLCVMGDGGDVGLFDGTQGTDVVLTGNLSRDQVLDRLAVADVMLYPTRRDALPNAVLEALGVGVPVVATPVGEIPDLVSNLAEDAGEMVRLIADGPLVRDPLPGYLDWEEQRRAYVRLFQAAARHRRPPAPA